MAETYKVIYPGNWVNRLSTYGLPNADFIANKRPAGDWADRQQQAVNYIPGWLAVTKTALVRVTSSPATILRPYIPAPCTRGDDKPLADVTQLVVPVGALLYRLGLRAVSLGNQPAYASQGANNPYSDLGSGIGCTVARSQLVLATALPTVLNTGLITATAAQTTNTPAATNGTVPTGGNRLTARTDLSLPIASTAVTAVPGSANAAVMSADSAFNVYSVDATGIAAGGGFSTNVPGGVYMVAEVSYLVPDAVAPLDRLPLPGHQYAGYYG
jgi:hypothetical protein